MGNILVRRKIDIFARLWITPTTFTKPVGLRSLFPFCLVVLLELYILSLAYSIVLGLDHPCLCLSLLPPIKFRKILHILLQAYPFIKLSNEILFGFVVCIPIFLSFAMPGNLRWWIWPRNHTITDPFYTPNADVLSHYYILPLSYLCSGLVLDKSSAVTCIHSSKSAHHTEPYLKDLLLPLRQFCSVSFTEVLTLLNA